MLGRNSFDSTCSVVITAVYVVGGIHSNPVAGAVVASVNVFRQTHAAVPIVFVHVAWIEQVRAASDTHSSMSVQVSALFEAV